MHVRSSDAVAVAGVTALLAGHPRLQIVDEDEIAAASVVVQVDDGRGVPISRPAGQPPHEDDRAPVVLLIADDLADDDLLAALDARVSGVLKRRDTSRGQLISAVLALSDGAVLLPPRLQGLLVQHLRRVRSEVLDPNGLTLSGLTARERDVLKLVAEGMDTNQIADELSFSPRTVKYVLTAVMTRYSLKSRTHAVAYAVRVGAI